MGFSTSVLSVIPWAGGLNASVDGSLIGQDELITADNIVYATNVSMKKRQGFNSNWDDFADSDVSIIKLHDFWTDDGGTKSHEILGFGDDGTVYTYTNGTRTDISPAVSPASPERITTKTFNNLTIIGFEGDETDNVLHYYDTDDAEVFKLVDHPDYGGSDPDPPNGWIVQEHLGRLWTNDKTRSDRLHYSETFNHLKWQGIGDSGALDIGIDDGDPVGITAIFPSFKGDLFVAKRTKLYRISGTSPETFVITCLSDSIGCVSANSVVKVDTDDLFWVSERGIHALSATVNFGDFESSFVSGKIQKAFNEFQRSRLKFCQSAYLPVINSVAFTFSSSTSSTQDLLYLFNIETKAWYTWSGIQFESIVVANDSDTPRFYFGNEVTRVVQSQTGDNEDVDTDGDSVAITMTIQTGLIYPDKSPYTTKGFKRFGIFYGPSGTQAFTVIFTVDRYTGQTLEFNELTSQSILGEFILGVDQLGSTGNTVPYSKTIDGYGRGFNVRLVHNTTGEAFEALGFTVEYEPAGVIHEVRNSS